MGRIPNEFIQDLLEHTDLGELIGERIPLRRVGVELVGLCPFHRERSPSFTVSPKGFYHCFGCGAHGNALQFVMTHDHLPFREAVDRLARRAGLALPNTNTDTAGDSRQAGLLELVATADRWFRRQLRTHPSRDRAIAYLKGRGIDGRTAAAFGLGYAPPGWNGLVRHLTGQGATLADLIAAGLAVGSRNGGAPFDRFRNRILFPVRDRSGCTRGFGARTLGQGNPKYLNSPESPVFRKGRSLFGLYEALGAGPRLQELVIVEGYLDVLTLHQHGLKTVIAVQGTAATPEQLATLFRYSRRLVFAFDGDGAGGEAAWRLLERLLPLLEDSREAAFVTLPPGEDPDSLIRSRGASAFQELLSRAAPLSNFLLDGLRNREHVNEATPEGRSRLLQAARPLLDRLPESLYRQLLAQWLSETIGKANDLSAEVR